ncbi:MAG: efflux RND transporter periplasmic adaptor subunit [Roseitalea sp.]|nr:efflux RND transporter periplasmic adaptor subunit [Roseitalea sp.]MBO6741490.1 efflux RND transporter periplasmic adaptor subunit [Roseitalea sp.]
MYAQDGPRPAKVETVAAEAAERSWTFPAIVLPSQEVSLSFRVSGQVTELPIRAAAPIAAGDVIAKLDPRDFEAQVAQLESQRDQSLAQLDALRSGARDEEVRAQEAAVESARAQADLARDDVERTQQLVERGVVSRVNLEQAESQLRVAEASLRAQQEQLAIAQAGGRDEDIASAEAGLRGLEAQLESARDNLADTVLTAPFDGVVARRSIDNFTLIQAGQEIVLLQNIATVHLAFDVPGTDVPDIAQTEQISAVATFSATESEFPAELVEFSTQAETATQTYRGSVSITAPEGSPILPGMVGRVILRGGKAIDPVISISLSAVGAEPDGAPFVWIVDEAGKVAKQSIETGAINGTRVRVLSGLEAGATIVAAGVSRLQDGMVIRPITQVGG